MTNEEAIKSLKDMISIPVWDIKNANAVERAIKALEQEPKSEWEHDHEILKAYSDGASDILDKIQAEIDEKQYDFMNCEDYDEGIRFGLMLAYQIIDKYKAESEVQE